MTSAASAMRAMLVARPYGDVERFQAAGAGAMLVGESLMLADDPAAQIGELRGTHVSLSTTHDSAVRA